jgi:hypothetical protein
MINLRIDEVSNILNSVGQIHPANHSSHGVRKKHE